MKYLNKTKELTLIKDTDDDALIGMTEQNDNERHLCHTMWRFEKNDIYGVRIGYLSRVGWKRMRA